MAAETLLLLLLLAGLDGVARMLSLRGGAMLAAKQRTHPWWLLPVAEAEEETTCRARRRCRRTCRGGFMVPGAIGCTCACRRRKAALAWEGGEVCALGRAPLL